MKKKAFTLTELLVVVVIIGVLAAVVLPKFTQVLETRRTTEAEEIMRAVRSEQEARCTLDKNYTANRAELASFPANEGNNYNYSFTATGIAAASRNKDYTLRIPSYRDGEICCDGDDCAHLGKTYPVCPARVAAVDECAAETACNLRSYSEACPSGQEGQVLFVPNADCTGYEQVNQCHDITVGPTTCSEGETRNVNRNCTGSSGERCEGGTWKHFASTDDGTPQPGDTTKPCPTGESVTCTYECNTTTGAWEPKCGECPTCTEGATRNVNSNCAGSSGERCESGTWKPFTSTDGGTSKPGDTTKTCSTGESVTCTYECNTTTGAWEPKCGECPTCTEGATRNVNSACGKKTGERCKNGEWSPFSEEVSLTQEEKNTCSCVSKPNDDGKVENCPGQGTGTHKLAYRCEDGAWVGVWSACPTLCTYRSRNENINIGQTYNAEQCNNNARSHYDYNLQTCTAAGINEYVQVNGQRAGGPWCKIQFVGATFSGSQCEYTRKVMYCVP